MTEDSGLIAGAVMRVEIFTAFPGMFDGFLGESMMARAIAQGILRINVRNLRDFADDPHQTLDDTPYGGGGGMILKVEPVARAIESVSSSITQAESPVIIIPTPRGDLFDQTVAEELSAQMVLVFVCGRYTGVDERIYDHFRPRRLCIGDYILSGGELPAMVIVDAVARHLPGFLGNEESGRGDSFVRRGLGPPHYTRPQNWRGLEVPDVLVSGHHANVTAWRDQKARETTLRFRPALIDEVQPGTGDASDGQTKKRVSLPAVTHADTN